MHFCIFEIEYLWKVTNLIFLRNLPPFSWENKFSGKQFRTGGKIASWHLSLNLPPLHLREVKRKETLTAKKQKYKKTEKTSNISIDKFVWGIFMWLLLTERNAWNSIPAFFKLLRLKRNFFSILNVNANYWRVSYDIFSSV